MIKKYYITDLYEDGLIISEKREYGSICVELEEEEVKKYYDSQIQYYSILSKIRDKYNKNSKS